MRRIAALLLLLSWARAAPDRLPTSRCILAAKPAGLKVVADTGLIELDKRIKSECAFLKPLFGVEAEIVLVDGGTERKAFVVGGKEGKGTIFVSAAWMKQLWAGENRVATVAAVLAHQHAHLLQGKRGCALPEWSREKQADLLAGFYLGKRNIATIGSEKELDAAFAASLFVTPDDFVNAPFEHGTPQERARAVRDGFGLFRADRLTLDKVYDAGLTLFPPPNEGLDAVADLEQALDADGLGAKPDAPKVRVKVACTHQGPCRHKIECTHPKPCVHMVACKHQLPCVHKTPCVHRVPCEHKHECVHRMKCIHQVPCVHRTDCTHKTLCVHWIPCTHTKHAFDYAHPFDRDRQGNRIQCVHRVDCCHFVHDHDYLHNFDYKHDYDTEHEFDVPHEYDTEHPFDTEHESDIPHEFDTEHPFDPQHESDPAHEWDPIHDHDLAHDSDPIHDYDVRFAPER